MQRSEDHAKTVVKTVESGLDGGECRGRTTVRNPTSNKVATWRVDILSLVTQRSKVEKSDHERRSGRVKPWVKQGLLSGRTTTLLVFSETYTTKGFY
jgi:hypothetical protein